MYFINLFCLQIGSGFTLANQTSSATFQTERRVPPPVPPAPVNYRLTNHNSDNDNQQQHVLISSSPVPHLKSELQQPTQRQQQKCPPRPSPLLIQAAREQYMKKFDNYQGDFWQQLSDKHSKDSSIPPPVPQHRNQESLQLKPVTPLIDTNFNESLKQLITPDVIKLDFDMDLQEDFLGLNVDSKGINFNMQKNNTKNFFC